MSVYTDFTTNIRINERNSFTKKRHVKLHDSIERKIKFLCAKLLNALKFW